MNPTLVKFLESAHRMFDGFISRLPALIVAVLVFILFYAFSRVLARVILRTTPTRRRNLGVVFSRLAGSAIVFLGFLVAFSIVAPSFQGADLIEVLGISAIAIGFAFQNILQNFLAGLLLIWSEPFRVGDDIKLDAFEGTVEEIQTRATIIKTADERRVYIPNADLFTRSVVVNRVFNARRWEYDLVVRNIEELPETRRRIVRAIQSVPGVLPEPFPRALVVDLDFQLSDSVKLRVLWWTGPPRQHQVLASYDKVLTAIAETFSQREQRATRVA